jgi:DNA-binding IclR family transcriptional regulator
MRLREERMLPLPRAKKREHLEREVIAALTLNPSADVKDLSNYLAIPVRTAYDLLQKMESKGLVMHTDRGGFWTMLQNRSDLFCRFGEAEKVAKQV